MLDKEKVTSVSTSASVSASAFGVGILRPGTVQVTVSKQVNPESLHQIIDTIINQHGCTACGLGGIDIVIRQQDPRVFEAFQHIQEVREVTVYR